MTKYSNTAKKPGQYLKGLAEHFRLRRDATFKGRIPDRGNINECFRPSNGASKADLSEYHREEMRLRKSRRRRLA